MKKSSINILSNKEIEKLLVLIEEFDSCSIERLILDVSAGLRTLATVAPNDLGNDFGEEFDKNTDHLALLRLLLYLNSLQLRNEGFLSKAVMQLRGNVLSSNSDQAKNLV